MGIYTLFISLVKVLWTAPIHRGLLNFNVWNGKNVKEINSTPQKACKLQMLFLLLL